MALLRIADLHKSYVAGKPVLTGVSFAIDTPQLVAIIGASGTGKSTLIRCVNRLVSPSSGSIHLGDTDLTNLSGKALRTARARIGMVFQEYNLVERLSVMENVLTGALGRTTALNAWLRKFSQQDIDAAWALLERVGLSNFANTRADALSGGQRQRVGIARAVMQQPALLLADEPTSSLDPKTSVEIMELLRGIAAERGIPILVNMHDVALAKRFADRIIGLRSGEKVFDGAASQLNDSDLSTIYGGESWLQ